VTLKYILSTSRNIRTLDLIGDSMCFEFHDFNVHRPVSISTWTILYKQTW